MVLLSKSPAHPQIGEDLDGKRVRRCRFSDGELPVNCTPFRRKNRTTYLHGEG